MSFPLVQEEADATEGGIRAKGTTELLQLGVFAVLVVLKCLPVAAGVRTIFALEHNGLLLLSRVFGHHVITELIFAFACISANLTYERFGLMS